MYCMAFKLGIKVDVCREYNAFMLVSMILTLMQGHSGSAKAKYERRIISTTKQAISIRLPTTVGHIFVTLTLKTFI